jgi:hypothetical protein
MHAVQITVLHNVDRDGRLSGYSDGNRLVTVFKGTHHTEAADPQVIADELFAAFNDGGHLPGAGELSDAYFGRRLRSLSVGDVVLVAEAALAIGRFGGFSPVSAAGANVLTSWHEDAVTVIWKD